MSPTPHFPATVPAALGWLLLGLGVIGIWRAARDQNFAAGPPRWKGWLLTAALLVAFRWPSLWLPHQQNPDESQLIAGAITLRHDPVFWRSVDGNTAGPFDFYVLLPASWGDGVNSYAIARMIGLALAFGTIVLAGETIALVAGTAIAQLCVLPAVLFQAFTSNPDFLFYSTELMPAFLIALAGYAALRQQQGPAPRWPWIAGLALGAAPWAKLQVVPLAAVLWVVIAAGEFRTGRRRSLMPLAAGALLPGLACFSLTTLTGQTEHLVTSFLLHNLAYVGAPQFSWGDVALLQWHNALLDGYLGFWLAGTAAFIVIALAAGGSRPPAPGANRYALPASLLLVFGIFCALGPRRPSAHHLQLLMPAVLWLAGAHLARIIAFPLSPVRRRLVLGGFVACCCLPQLACRLWRNDPFAPIQSREVSPVRRELARVTRLLSAPDEPLAMWGWRCSLYVEAGRRQATRQAHTEPLIDPGPLQPYFLRRYLEDFQASNAPVFVDAVGPGNFAFNTPRQAHESFGPLREWVRARYTQVATLDGTRVFARNDRLDRLKAAAPGHDAPPVPK